MEDTRSGLKIGDVIDYIQHTTADERSKIVDDFLTDMATLAQSVINLFEKNRICLSLFDIGIVFKVVDYTENTEIISLKHGFPVNGIPLTRFILNTFMEKENGLEESGSSENEDKTE